MIKLKDRKFLLYSQILKLIFMLIEKKVNNYFLKNKVLTLLDYNIKKLTRLLIIFMLIFFNFFAKRFGTVGYRLFDSK